MDSNGINSGFGDVVKHRVASGVTADSVRTARTLPFSAIASAREIAVRRGRSLPVPVGTGAAGVAAQFDD